MASRDPDTLTGEHIENDPNFKSFLSFTEAPRMDNTTTNPDNMAFVNRQSPRAQGSLLAETMDRTNTTAVLKRDFEEWYSALEQKQVLTIRKDVEAALAQENPETMKIQDIFKIMASKANQRWDTAADQLISHDVERAQSLYLTAPNIKNKVDKLKHDVGLMKKWTTDVDNMSSSQPHWAKKQFKISSQRIQTKFQTKFLTTSQIESQI